MSKMYLLEIVVCLDDFFLLVFFCECFFDFCFVGSGVVVFICINMLMLKLLIFSK